MNQMDLLSAWNALKLKQIFQLLAIDGEGGEGEAGGDQLALEDKSEKASDR